MCKNKIKIVSVAFSKYSINIHLVNTHTPHTHTHTFGDTAYIVQIQTSHRKYLFFCSGRFAFYFKVHFLIFTVSRKQIYLWFYAKFVSGRLELFTLFAHFRRKMFLFLFLFIFALCILRAKIFIVGIYEPKFIHSTIWCGVWVINAFIEHKHIRVTVVWLVATDFLCHRSNLPRIYLFVFVCFDLQEKRKKKKTRKYVSILMNFWQDNKITIWSRANFEGGAITQ